MYCIKFWTGQVHPLSPCPGYSPFYQQSLKQSPGSAILALELSGSMCCVVTAPKICGDRLTVRRRYWAGASMTRRFLQIGTNALEALSKYVFPDTGLQGTEVLNSSQAKECGTAVECDNDACESTSPAK
ncbi:hypothetical protein BJX61DRAFT_505494 [Aspergillus egyptiacus]|nr:hypothetical protein BJX61DRAFT_505494 [Aspergillus egyptiacus]